MRRESCGFEPGDIAPYILSPLHFGSMVWPSMNWDYPFIIEHAPLKTLVMNYKVDFVLWLGL